MVRQVLPQGRLCASCGLVKPLGAFRRVKAPMRDGRSSYCDTCALAATRAWRSRNRETLNAARRNPQHRLACVRCGIQFATGIPHQRYCSVGCREKWRSANQPRLSLGSRTRQRILKRDAWRCYLCSRPIDPGRPYPDDLSGTVDHVVPVAAGGTDRVANLRAAHWQCNKEKGANDAPWWVAA